MQEPVVDPTLVPVGSCGLVCMGHGAGSRLSPAGLTSARIWNPTPYVTTCICRGIYLAHASEPTYYICKPKTPNAKTRNALNHKSLNKALQIPLEISLGP